MEIEKPITTKETNNRSSKLPLVVIGVFLLVVVFFFVLGILIEGRVLVCRNIFGQPYPTGIISEAYEFENEGFQVWKTTACIKDVYAVSADEAIIEIGYFDKFWRMHTYKARLGGKNPLVGICTRELCSLKKPEEFIGNIDKGDLVELTFVTEDSNSQSLDSELADSYLAFVEKLKEALLQKTGFPKSEQILQIWEIMISK